MEYITFLSTEHSTLNRTFHLGPQQHLPPDIFQFAFLFPIDPLNHLVHLPIGYLAFCCIV